jgi:hypothetical protein
MVELAQSYHELEKCTKDILSVIKPTEDDRKKRLLAIQEIVNSVHLVGYLGGNFLLFGYHMALSITWKQPFAIQMFNLFLKGVMLM